MKVYLIAFDLSLTNMTLAHNAITSLPGGEWWHYLSGMYLITSNDLLLIVRQKLLERWPGGPVLITELRRSSDGFRPDGLLAQEAWDWINARLG